MKYTLEQINQALADWQMADDYDTPPWSLDPRTLARQLKAMMEKQPKEERL